MNSSCTVRLKDFRGRGRCEGQVRQGRQINLQLTAANQLLPVYCCLGFSSYGDSTSLTFATSGTEAHPGNSAIIVPVPHHRSFCSSSDTLDFTPPAGCSDSASVTYWDHLKVQLHRDAEEIQKSMDSVKSHTPPGSGVHQLWSCSRSPLNTKSRNKGLEMFFNLNCLIWRFWKSTFLEVTQVQLFCHHLICLPGEVQFILNRAAASRGGVVCTK